MFNMSIRFVSFALYIKKVFKEAKNKLTNKTTQWNHDINNLIIEEVKYINILIYHFD